MTNQTTGTLVKPEPIAGAEIVQVTYALTHRKGAPTVTQEAVLGRSNWTTITNAQNQHDGVSSTMTGDVALARDGRLVGEYTNFTGKSELTITSVKLHFYGQVSGVILANSAYIRTGWRLSGVDTQLEQVGTDANFLVTPKTYDITAARTWSWTDLDNLFFYAEGQIASTLVAVTLRMDAVELEVVADKTDTV